LNVTISVVVSATEDVVVVVVVVLGMIQFCIICCRMRLTQR